MKRGIFVYIFGCIFLLASAHIALGGDDATSNALKSGLVGAGTGAIAAGTTGGKAGQGALIGAGTGVIGSVLLDAITGSGSSGNRRQYQDEKNDDDYYYEEEANEPPPQEDATTKVLKSGLVGAGTGAIAAGTSGGNAGKGALIGAGTSVIGNVLLDTITKPSSQRRAKRVIRKKGPRNKVIRKYDDKGNLVYEEIVPMDDEQ